MKRKLKWIAVILAVLLVGLGVALFVWPRDRITTESWKKIRIGMTVKEVESILGRPGSRMPEFLAHLDALEKKLGKYPFVSDGISFAERDPQDVAEKSRIVLDKGGFVFLGGEQYWIGQRGCMEIRFDPQGQVKWKRFNGWRSAAPTFLDRLRDWLGL